VGSIKLQRPVAPRGGCGKGRGATPRQLLKKNVAEPRNQEGVQKRPTKTYEKKKLSKKGGGA